MPPEYKAKITINSDYSGATNAARAVNGVSGAANAASMALQGNFVGALVAARGAVVAFNAALMANPVIAVATAVLAIGAALARVAWSKHTAEIDAQKRAMEGLADATARYKKTLADIRYSNADVFERRTIRSAELRQAQEELDALKRKPAVGLTYSQQIKRESDTVAAQEKVAIAQDRLDAVRREIDELKSGFDREEQNTAERNRQEVTELQDRRAGIAEEQRTFGMSDVERLAELIGQREAAKNFLVESADSLSEKEAEQAQLEIDELTLQIKKLEKAMQDRTDLEKQTKDKAEQDKQKRAEELEADYAFSKLTPQEQLKRLDEQIDALETKKRDQGSLGGDDALNLVALKRKRDSIAAKAERQMAIPKEGFDDFLRDASTMTSSIRSADSRSANRFRSKLGASFADKLTPSQFAKGSGDGPAPQTAEQRLLSLQEQSVGYQKIIAEKVQNLGLKE